MSLATLRTTTTAFTIDGVRVQLDARIYDDGRFALCGTFQGGGGQVIGRVGEFYDDSSAHSDALENVVAAWETYHLQVIPEDEAAAVFAALAELDGSDLGSAPGLDELSDLDGGDSLQSDAIAANVEIYRAWARTKGYDLDKGRDAPENAGIGSDDAGTFDDARACIALDKEGSDYCSDWSYGVQLIPECQFQDHAEELARDTGMVKDDATWPNNHIDWEAAARELRQDYTEIDYKGTTYLVR